MFSFRRVVVFATVYCFLTPGLSAPAQGPASVAQAKLSLKAALVLTPEFCKTVTKKSGEKFPVGKAACRELEGALKETFTTLILVDDSSRAGDAQLILEPKFSDVATTRRAFAFSKREFDVLVDWTVRDENGKAIWIETVEGTASRHMGNAFTYGSNLKHIVENSVQDMANQSAAKMAASPQLRKLSDAPVK